MLQQIIEKVAKTIVTLILKHKTSKNSETSLPGVIQLQTNTSI